MKHPSAYLDWYAHVPDVTYDFRSSGLSYFGYELDMGKVDLSANYVHGNPTTTELIAKMYRVEPENVLTSSEGASGLNARIIRYLAESDPRRNEAVVEYPVYEPLQRQVQEYFPIVKRLGREEKESYRLDADRLKRIVSKKTGLLVLTNPHAPSGAVSGRNELKEIMNVAAEKGFFVLCDEIYAEFNREAVPTAFSVDPERGIAATSFTKAYGLGGLKFGAALANRELVDELYADVLSTVGNFPNVVQLVATELLSKGKDKLKRHQRKWLQLRERAEKWFRKERLEYFPNRMGVTYWIRLPMKDTYRWVIDHAIPEYSVAPVPGAFFLYKRGYKLEKSDMIRLGLGNINPGEPNLNEGLEAMKQAIDTYSVT